METQDWRTAKPGHQVEHRDPITWPFLTCGLVIAIVILLARAWGLLP